ncbi:MAG: DUF2335 domain-containing protein [Desulfovibrionaceae bacterium]|nr:DUF2335 domain-containing protein [Desulfovibrionaceae bacterium]
MVSTTVYGPLPPPETLAAYEKLVPGTAKRILDMAQAEQETRHELARAGQISLEKHNAKEHRAVTRGQWLAFVLIFVCIAGSIYSAMRGHELTSLLLAGAPLASAISKLITRK